MRKIKNNRVLVLGTATGAVLAGIALSASPAQAQLFWDPSVAGNGITGGSTTAATNDWRVGTNGIWWDGASNVVWANANNATFGGTAGSVRLGGPVSAGTLNFATAGYTIDLNNFANNAASNLTLTGLSGSTGTFSNTSNTTRIITLNNSADQTWSGSISGQRIQFIKQGAGTLSFAGTLPGGFGGTSVDIQNGKIELVGATSTLTGGAVNIGATGTLDLKGQNLSLRSVGSASFGLLTTSAGNSDVIGNFGGSAFTLNGQVTSGIRFLLRDNITLTLGGNNSFTRGVAFNLTNLFNTTGTAITANHDNALGTGLIDLSSSSGTVRLNLTTLNPVVGALAGTSSSTKIVTLGSTGIDSTVEVGSLGTTTEFNGQIENFSGRVGSVKKVGAGTLTLSGASTYTGTTTVNAGTLSVTGSLANNGSASVIVNGITSASAAQSLAAAPAIVRTRASLATYAGFGSTIGTNDSFGGAFKTKADILGGTNSSGPSESVSMQWRGRASQEAPLQAPGSLFSLGGGLGSDILNLTGMSNGGAPVLGRVQTDVFVLQMTYNPAAIGIATSLSEANAATAGLIALGYLSLGSDGTLGGTLTAADSWVNAISGNFGSNTGATNVQGSWAVAGLSTLVLGSWGVDTATDTVWAVINHNSQYAVIPEPGTLGSVILGAVGLLGLRRRSRMC